MNGDPCAACPVSNLRKERELRRSQGPDAVTVAIVVALMNGLFIVIGYVLGHF